METDGPAPCAISLSQELDLRRSEFHGQADSEFPAFSSGDNEQADFPVASTPIIIESFPETPQQEGVNEGAAADGPFETPPEDFASADGSQIGEGRDRGSETVPINVHRDSVDIAVAIDSGHDVDLGFSKSIHRTEVVPSKLQECSVLKRGSSPENFDSSVPPSKRSKSASSESLSEKGTIQGLPTEVVELINLFDVLRPKSVNNASPSTKEKNAGSAGSAGTRSTADGGGGEALNNGVGEAAENVVEAGGDAGGREAKETKRSLKSDLLAMVKAVMRITGELPLPPERGVQLGAVLEIAKSMGMKFPRPEWWPPEREF